MMIFVVHQTTLNMPDTNTVVHTQTWAGCRSKNMLSVRAPLTDGSITRLDRAHLFVILLQIVDVHLACQISKASHQDKSPMWGEKDSVSWSKVEAVLCNGALVEDGRLGRHVAIHHAKFFRIWRPSHVMDGTFLVQLNAGVKPAIGAEDVHVGLSVITLVALVNLCLCQDNDTGTLVIPLELHLVALEECLLRHGRCKLWDLEHLDCSWLALALRDEDSY